MRTFITLQHNRLRRSTANATAISTHARQKGFSLIEVMVVVAIIGILAAIAIPSYADYVKRAKATEATSILADLKVKMEQYYQDNRTYLDIAGTTAPCAPPSGSSKYFSFSCGATQTSTSYTITASPVSGQGMTNFKFSIDQNNTKTSIFDGTSGNCWLTSKGGTC
jgi:type IV pilus assembly protein PilE